MKWFLRDVTSFQRDPLELLKRSHSAEEEFTRLYLGPQPIYLVNQPETARDILGKMAGTFEKGRLIGKLKPILGESLLTNVSKPYAASKRAIHRHIQRNQLVQNLPELSAVLTNVVAQFAKSRVINTDDVSALIALRLGAIAIFGHDTLTDADRIAIIDAVQTVEAEIAADMFRMLPALPWAAKRRRDTIEGCRLIIAQVVRQVRANDKKSPLIRGLEESGLSDEQINAEILGLLISGHHTTGAAISWIMHHLANEPEITAAIAAEIDLIHEDIDDGLEESLSKAPISYAFVQEVLRVYPPGWWTSREAMKPVEIAGKSFRKGDVVMISPYLFHHDPRCWDAPDEFRVDRDYGTPAFMPFGIGPRSCIGMAIARLELQLLVLHFASALRFNTVLPKTPKPIPSVTLLAPNIMLEAKVRPAKHVEMAVA